MSKRKVCVVVTARPSYARIRSALSAIRDRSDLELQLVVAASALLDRYGNTAAVICDEGFRIDRCIHSVGDGETLIASARSTGFGISKMAEIIADLAPDIVVSVADRFETMATAVAAAYMNVPLAHVQGGEVTGSIDEKVRHAVTKLADIHLVASEKAAARVIRMGERPDAVHVTGCPSIDIARAAIRAPRLDDDILAMRGDGGPALDLENGYIIVMQHPVSTEYAASRTHMEETLHAVAGLGLPALWFWPNADAGSDGMSDAVHAFRERHPLPHVLFLKNLPPEPFLRLLDNSLCIVGNSSVAIRECAYIGVPAVNIGSRQTGRDRGRNVVDADYDRHAIAAAIRRQAGRGRLEPDLLYGDGEAGRRIAEVLARTPLVIEKRLAY